MNRVGSILIIFVMLVLNANAQVILPLGNGQINSENIISSTSDHLFVLSKVNGDYRIDKWDGHFWIEQRDIPQSILNTIATSPSERLANQIYFYKGILYFAIKNSKTQHLYVLKYNGVEWSLVTDPNPVFVQNTVKFIETGSELLICGKIMYNTTDVSMLKVNDNDFDIFAYSPATQDVNDYYSDFEYCGGKVWAIGLFTAFLDPDKKYFSYYENNVWKIVENPPGLFGFVGMGKYNNRLVIVSKNLQGKLSFAYQSANQGNWDDISGGLNDIDIASVSDIHQVGNLLWVSGSFFNTALNEQMSLMYWDGMNWNFPNFDYLGADVKLGGQNQVYVSGSFYAHQGLSLNKTGVLNFGSAIIAGKVFMDQNQNCTQEYGELPAKGIMIKLVPDNIYTITDYNGNYFFPVDSSKKVHAVEMMIPKYHISTCESFIGTKHYKDLTIAGIDFGLIPSGKHTDAAVSLQDYTGWRARQGFTEKYQLCVENKGTEDLETGKLLLKHDQRLENWNFSTLPDLQMNNSIEWTIHTLAPNHRFCITAKAEIPVEIPLSTMLDFDVTVYTTDIQDEDLIDNNFKLVQKVVAAIDPNDKVTKQDFFILPSTPELNYKIRFQNTGTDTAYNIVVSDSMDNNLKIPSVFYNPVSHEDNVDFAPHYWRGTDGKLRYKFAWKFKNILLPDSGTNFEQSQGFIEYNLNLKPDLKPSTLIRNKAYIYFDYQEPILTNTAINVISLNTGIKVASELLSLHIAPNPAKEEFSISNSSEKDLEFRIFNTIGQQQGIYKISRKSTLTVPVNSLSKGIYLIRAEGYEPVKLLLH
ncbi:MAG: T9SS type A sorting domain-containing protein [Flavobacteriales bacterium]|nr:T9SS type A sorting domain-containing protein [Flavobacteriales bacterium]